MNNLKPLLACLLVVFVSCSVLRTVWAEDILAKNRENLNRLSMGMLKSDVLNIMGTQTITAYESAQSAQMIVITNPYRTEIMKNEKGENLEVLFYYTDEKRLGQITDNELTPIVLKDGKVEGWGRSYLMDVVYSYRARLH